MALSRKVSSEPMTPEELETLAKESFGGRLGALIVEYSESGFSFEDDLESLYDLELTTDRAYTKPAEALAHLIMMWSHSHY